MIDGVKDVVIPDRVVTEDASAVLFSTHPTMTKGQGEVSASLIIAELLESKGIERRRLESTQDAGTAEPWLVKAVELAPDDRPSLVLIGKSSAKVKAIPETVSDMEKIIGNL